MKRLLVVIALMAMSITLFADITPYGSALIGWWFHNEDEELAAVSDGRWSLNKLHLQGNAHLGIDFEKGMLTAKGEVNFDIADEKLNPAYLWGRYDFGDWSMLIGLDGDGFADMVADQVMFDDNGLVGYGALDTGVNTTIRFEMPNGLYVALINPVVEASDSNYVAVQNKELSDLIDVIDHILPKINLGYRWKIMDGDMLLHTSLLVQRYKYNSNPELNEQHYLPPRNKAITSILFGVDWRWQINNETKLGLSGYYGMNPYDMGVKGHKNYCAILKDTYSAETGRYLDTEVNNVTSMGGFMTLGHTLKEDMELNFGVGYASDDYKQYQVADTRLGLYLQPKLRFGELQVVPEFGYLMEMDKMMETEPNDSSLKKEGNAMYFGLQLRYDF